MSLKITACVVFDITSVAKRFKYVFLCLIDAFVFSILLQNCFD